MKKLIGLFTGAVLGGLVSQAQAADRPDISRINPNAVVQVLLNKVETHAGKNARPLPYTKASDASIVCLGKIPAEIDMKDDKGLPRFADSKPFVPDIITFAQNPDAQDKAAQSKMRNILETRTDLAYVEYTHSTAPSAQEINTYFKDVFKSEPLDVFTGATRYARSLSRTTILMDQSGFEKFLTANMTDIRAMHDKQEKEAKGLSHYTYSACGLKTPS